MSSFNPRADCKLCGESNLVSHVLNGDGHCPTCADVLAGKEPVTSTWLCPKCGSRMYSGFLAGGGKAGCCWMMPATEGRCS